MKQSRGSLVYALLVAFPLSIPALGQEQEEVLTNADIISLSDAGVPPEAIVIKIESTRADFDTTVEQLVALSVAGVDASVVAAMTRKDSADPEPPDPAAQQETPAPAEAGERPEPIEQEDASARAAPSDAASPAAEPVSPATRVAAFRPGVLFADTMASGGLGPEMVVIPAGRFRMGCVTRRDCFRDERPVHLVAFSEPFAVSRYAITFEEYDRFSGPGRVSDGDWGRGRRPVINVSWDQAGEYAAWLSRETGRKYRLLTEAEWEYAARAGSDRKYHFGDEIEQLCRYANHADAGTDYEWRNTLCADGTGKQTAVVGSYAPNAFGLYDMHGNVWEWVQDCWNDHYRRAPRNGQAWLEGDCSKRVVRGGSFGYEAASLRSAYRASIEPRIRNNDIGFRIARDLAP